LEPPGDINRIMACLPHRYPFLLVDRVTAYEPGQWLKAYKNVTANEPFFQGHFPDRPIMPGVLIVEAMAQAAGLLAWFSQDDPAATPGVAYMAGLDKVKFRRPVVPGDRLDLSVQIVRLGARFWKVRAEAKVGAEKAAEAVLTTAYDGSG
jgi:beta-hydroxyacyl-ACP dehydratase FabZ